MSTEPDVMTVLMPASERQRDLVHILAGAELDERTLTELERILVDVDLTALPSMGLAGLATGPPRQPSQRSSSLGRRAGESHGRRVSIGNQTSTTTTQRS